MAATRNRTPMQPPTATRTTRPAPAPGPTTRRAATTNLTLPPRVAVTVDREPVAESMRPMMSRIRPHPNAASIPDLQPAPGVSAGGGLCRPAPMPSTHCHEPEHLGQPAGYRARHHRTVLLKAALPASQARSSRSGPCQTPRLSASRWVTAGRLSSCNLIGIHTWIADKQAVPAATDVVLQLQGRAAGGSEMQRRVPFSRRRRTNCSSG